LRAAAAAVNMPNVTLQPGDEEAFERAKLAAAAAPPNPMQLVPTKLPQVNANAGALARKSAAAVSVKASRARKIADASDDDVDAKPDEAKNDKNKSGDSENESDDDDDDDAPQQQQRRRRRVKGPCTVCDRADETDACGALVQCMQVRARVCVYIVAGVDVNVMRAAVSHDVPQHVHRASDGSRWLEACRLAVSRVPTAGTR
jgi:hypothetical protein